MEFLTLGYKIKVHFITKMNVLQENVVFCILNLDLDLDLIDFILKIWPNFCGPSILSIQKVQKYSSVLQFWC